LSFIDDPGGLSVDFIAVEAPEPGVTQQALWVAVRPIYHGNEPSSEPMVQIAYQEAHMQGNLQGPVWLSTDTWRQLNRAVEHRIKAHEKRKRWFKRWL
jgi:hypothetical protein